MIAKLVRPESPEWMEALQLVPHDIYHLPEYVQLAAKSENGLAHLFIFELPNAVFCLPLVLRPVPTFLCPPADAVWDASSPYGYPGPIWGGTPGLEPEAFLRLAMNALRDILRAHSVVTCFIRTHPILTPGSLELGDSTHVVTHGRTVSIDLNRPQEEIWQDVRHNHRRDINKARRRGITATTDPEWSELAGFLRLYHDTMRRLGAAREYFFSPAYFDDLLSSLRDSLVLCVVKRDDLLLTAGLFSEYQGIVQYMLSGTSDEGLSVRAPKTMLHYMQQWAQSRGHTHLHLGGGLGGSEDALFDFKAGFSKCFSPFSTWRMVINPKAYAKLRSSWESTARTTADPLSGFFPCYRKSVPRLALLRLSQEAYSHEAPRNLL